MATCCRTACSLSTGVGGGAVGDPLGVDRAITVGGYIGVVSGIGCVGSDWAGPAWVGPGGIVDGTDVHAERDAIVMTAKINGIEMRDILTSLGFALNNE
jgi:hypothetical protein